MLCCSVVDAVPCRIAFERGKERHFHFLTISVGISGWLILADELPVRPSFGVVRVVAPLGGCNVSMPSFLFCDKYTFLYPFLLSYVLLYLVDFAVKKIRLL